ncbi:sensor histidine kinase [Rhodohalobacter barkolensis]|uniref:histidine kinase n=1 Tax=Rhodohalobacter barkolensis TaxID=2053187 RepID=A0A2N0VL40_9BACT|nr:HAMP domain-containing sensor histidine kinase [Rhodohalobacter barkolensis]PKD44900.1 hypothetical protein CWD77_05420 [Rhodohalobacter barkolensis]
MKLITKFIWIYLTVTLIVLGIAGFLSYHIITDEINNELKWEFLERIDRVTYLIDRGRRFHPKRSIEGDRNLIVERLDSIVEPKTEVSDTLIWHDRLEQNERNVKVSAYRTIDGESYFISTYGAMIESDDIKEAVLKILFWILLLQVLGAFGIGYFVSGRLFKPFRKTLDQIKTFKLNSKSYLPAEKTGVKEFDNLNRFVEDMTRKAVSDYQNLKEFSENASHELQTPLAIAKGKLELLAETPLNEEQYKHVEALERTVKKLSRLSESLSLLTRIENEEFEDSHEVNFSNLISEGIKTFSEFIEFNNLTLETDIADNVIVNIHPALADILWTNLLQNSIKHNVDNGFISIKLTPHLLTISNSGKPTETEPYLFFERFRKADQNSSSIGLGLAIIERIVQQNSLDISYEVNKSIHTVTIQLKNVNNE